MNSKLIRTQYFCEQNDIFRHFWSWWMWWKNLVVLFLVSHLMEQSNSLDHARTCYIFLVIMCALRCLSMMHFSFFWLYCCALHLNPFRQICYCSSFPCLVSGIISLLDKLPAFSGYSFLLFIKHSINFWTNMWASLWCKFFLCCWTYCFRASWVLTISFHLHAHLFAIRTWLSIAHL
jgi:hypothetical protein